MNFNHIWLIKHKTYRFCAIKTHHTANQSLIPGGFAELCRSSLLCILPKIINVESNLLHFFLIGPYLMDGEPETIKRVCCKAALTSRTFITPAYHLVHLPLSLHGWGAGDNKKSLLRSSIDLQDFYDPQHMIWFTSL